MQAVRSFLFLERRGAKAHLLFVCVTSPYSTPTLFIHVLLPSKSVKVFLEPGKDQHTDPVEHEPAW